MKRTQIVIKTLLFVIIKLKKHSFGISQFLIQKILENASLISIELRLIIHQNSFLSFLALLTCLHQENVTLWGYFLFSVLIKLDNFTLGLQLETRVTRLHWSRWMISQYFFMFQENLYILWNKITCPTTIKLTIWN